MILRRRIGVAAILLLGLGLAVCEAPTAPGPAPNHDPILDSLRLRPDRVAAGRPVEVTVHARDLDGDPLLYDYEPDAGRIVGSGARVIWLPPETVGPYGLTVRVRDRRGGHALDRTGVTVMPPTRIVGQLVQFQGSVSLIGTIVAVFRNYADYVQYRPAQPPTVLRTGNVFQASFVVDILEPGRYWFDAWKDVNNNGCRDAGDRLASYRDWGLYEEQFDVPEFHTVDLGQLIMRESGAPCAEGP